MNIKNIVLLAFWLCGFMLGLSAQPNPFVNNNPHSQVCVPSTDIEETLLADIVHQKLIDRNRRIGHNTYTIPVVFHIIHKDGAENISDDQVYSAMDQLNKDFNSGNADLVQVPAPFAGIIGNASINFALAKQAPDGSCTNGINRYLSGYDETYSYYWTDDGQYYLNTIKENHYWDVDKYLNVYVVNQSYNSGLAFFPYQIEARANAKKWLDGIMMRHYNLGTIGTAKYNTLPHGFAHEVGHFLDLMHIWGNWFYPGSSQLSWKNDCNYQDSQCPDFYCHSDDLVNDTPNTEYFFEGCVYETNTCGSSDNATNIMGYGCELMFTQGQVSRMHRALNSNLADRQNLWSQENLDYTLHCSGEKATIPCKKLYNSFIYDFSIVANNTGYILHSLNEILNKVRYRINGASWVEFNAWDKHYHTLTDIVACATYEFQISEQCDTIFSPWSASKFFYTNDAPTPEVNTSPPLDTMDCFALDTIQDCSQLQLSFQVNHQTYVNTFNGSAEVTPFGGNPPYQIEWSTGAQNTSINNLPPGFYTVTVTDSLNCMLMDSIEIFAVECDSLQLNLSATNETYFEANDGTAFAEVNNGAAPYSYYWSNGDSIASLYNLSPGWYSVIIEDSSGCKASNSINIEAIDCDLFDVEATINHQSYYGLNDGSIALEVLNGTPPFLYNWFNSVTVSVIENLSPDIYNFIVVDALGCKEERSIQIDSVDCKNFNMDIYTEDVSINQTNDGTAMVTLTGGNSPYEYVWSTGDTSPFLNGLSAGNYNIVATDSLGCQLIEQVIINSIICDSIYLNTTASNETYVDQNDGTAMVLATGGQAPYSYEWSTGETTQSITNTMPGEYWVKVSDSFNCSAIDSVTILAVNCTTLNLSINTTDETYVNANDGILSVEASGGHTPYQYNWSNGETTAYLEDLAPASYYLTLIDNLGCSIEDSVIINPVDCSALEIATNVNHETVNNGNDGSIILEVSGGEMPYIYQWSNGDATSQITDLIPGIYTYQVTDNVGCQLTGSQQIKSVECALLSVDVIQKEVTCNGGDDGSLFIAAVQNAHEPYEFNWSNGGLTYLNNNLEAGSYTLTLTDNLSCLFEQTYVIKDGKEISTDMIISPASSSQNPDASIDLNVTGGYPPYQFYWSNNTIEEDVNQIFTGIYWLSITDSLNCHTSITNIEVGLAENCPYNVVETQNAFMPARAIQAQHSIQSKRTIQNGDSLQYTAGSIIYLENDFEILKGGVFEAKIEGCLE